MSLRPILAAAAIWLAASVAGAQEATSAAAPEAAGSLSEEALADQRGGIATAMGLEIGFGASVRTYVDGSLALETRLTWAPEGARMERVFESDAARSLPADVASGAPVVVAPGVSVIHDVGANRIASVVLNTGNDRSIRQDTDITLHLPQLPDLQQRIAAERVTQALQALSPQASGLGN
ncbi:hypothetical protein [Phenylobacterium sp.]|jgi:hypothetical protein|uniref:hypothetical protein n=1 Tax=Phenylobacterium sp. TaxID=1871053 RepID=UPI002F94498D